MAKSTRWVQPTRFTGNYLNGYWAGYRFKERLGYTSGRHTGVDYNWGGGNDDLGQRVNAVANGKVVYAATPRGKSYGKTVIIRHELTAKQRRQSGGKKYAWTRYMHLNHISVKKGDIVKVGQKIGTVGKTGTVWAHLHIDLWTDKNGLGWHLAYHKDSRLDSYLDPYKWIQNHLEKEVQPKPEPSPSESPSTSEPVNAFPSTPIDVPEEVVSDETETIPEPQPEPEPEPEEPPEREIEDKPETPAPPRPEDPNWLRFLIEVLKRLFTQLFNKDN